MTPGEVLTVFGLQFLHLQNDRVDLDLIPHVVYVYVYMCVYAKMLSQNVKSQSNMCGSRGILYLFLNKTDEKGEFVFFFNMHFYEFLPFHWLFHVRVLYEHQPPEIMEGSEVALNENVKRAVAQETKQQTRPRGSREAQEGSRGKTVIITKPMED